MTVNFKVCMCTWNVGDSSPPEGLAKLLNIDAREPPNLLAIGLQELKSSSTALVADSVFDDPWTNKLTSELCAKNYVRIESVRLLGIHLVLFLKRSHLRFVTNIETTQTRTGFGGLWGNKGAVSVRVEVSGVNICIVNCHLAAHLEQVNTRIGEYDQILESQVFAASDGMTILDHDYVFWIGDLNFRLDDISVEETKEYVSQQKCDSLLQYDQLKKLMKEEMIFLDFQEGALTFPPTYKYDKGTSTYDTSKKKRKPAWCDRILWHVHEDSFDGALLNVQQLSYYSHQSFTNSDHKPVVSFFRIKVLKDAPSLPVIFDALDTWHHSADATFSFSVEKDFPVSSWDWIGIYKADFHHFRDYISYVWVPRSSDSKNADGSLFYRLKVDKSYVQEFLGRSCLCYYSSAKKCIVGYSPVFRVSLSTWHVDSSDDSSSSSSDSDS